MKYALYCEEGLNLRSKQPRRRQIRTLTVVDNFSRECLDTNWFLSLDDAKEKIESWRMEYNQYRPHSSLDDLTPEEFYQQHQKAGNLEFTGV